jgi:lipid-A-disaccharide synthase
VNDAPARSRPLTIMLVVGEPSGDQLGAELMVGLKKLAGDRVKIVGVGGRAMEAQGMKSLFPLDASSVMGLREVVPRIPEILRRVREASDYALAIKPDLLVVIDSPDFTHRIARKVKEADPAIATANYAPPQVWASRSYRARKMARYLDAVLTLLPFEAEFFARYGMKAYFVGFPVVERAARMTGGAAFRARRGIAPDAPLLAVLAGSRRNEIRFILPPFKDAVRILAGRISGLVSVMPTVHHVAHLVEAAARDWPTPVHVFENEDEKYAAFDAADVALAASGTVTTELALARTPMVVAYRLGWLTYTLWKPLMLVDRITLINLILKRDAVPEMIQEKCAGVPLADQVYRLLTDESARRRQIEDLDEAVRLFGEGSESPSLRAARAVLELAECSRRSSLSGRR